ncbi:TVP38/TMEM64 family protein [Virgibacillus sediminis]|uniref:TVP38/TMEM64 family membrane protein n=1 Tax=Virgibacillus sediminis TaxID=202260 RepID=A0ABV7AAZ9_9BACI
MKKALIFVALYSIILYIALIHREELIIWLDRANLAQLPLMFGLSILFSVIPIIPFTIFAGVMGVKYGVWVGAIINWTGSVGAAVIYFILARYYFVNQFQIYIQKFEKVQKFDAIISRNAFISVLISRMISIIPPPVVNIYSGLSTMQFFTYFIATALGQIPGMIIYAYLGNQLAASFQGFVAGLLIYLMFLAILIPIYRHWYRGA